MATKKANIVVPATPPPIPLSPENEAAYQDLYDKLQDEIESNTDAGYLESLNEAQQQVDDILDLDAKARLAKNTGDFSTVLTQIKAANKDLCSLRADIATVADRIKTAATIIAAIDKVTTILPL